MRSDLELILDHLDDQLEPEARVSFVVRLAREEHLRREFERVRALMQGLRDGPLPTAPPDLMDRAVRSFTDQRPPDPSASVLRLLFDSFAASPSQLAGVRGPGSARRLRFEGLGLELDLEMEDHGSEWRVRGQLTELGEPAHAPSEARLDFTTDAGDIVAVALDEDGTFSLSLARAEWHVELDDAGKRARCPLPDAGA